MEIPFRTSLLWEPNWTLRPHENNKKKNLEDIWESMFSTVQLLHSLTFVPSSSYILEHPYFQVSYNRHVFTTWFTSNRKRNILRSRPVSDNTPPNQQHYPSQVVQYFDKLKLTFKVQCFLSLQESCSITSGEDRGVFSSCYSFR